MPALDSSALLWPLNHVLAFLPVMIVPRMGTWTSGVVEFSFLLWPNLPSSEGKHAPGRLTSGLPLQGSSMFSLNRTLRENLMEADSEIDFFSAPLPFEL